MVSFTDYAGSVLDRSNGAMELALVPLVYSFLQVGNLQRLAAFDGVRFSLRLVFPQPVVSLWSFVEAPPPTTGGFEVTGPATGPLVLLPVLVVVEAVLVAGFLGSLDEAFRTGEYGFLRNVRRYGLDLLVYNVIVAGVAVGSALLLVGVVGTAGAGGVVLALLFGLPAVLVLGYLFYAAPFLVVVEDRNAVAAFARSAALAADFGPYAGYFIRHAVVGGVVAILATPVVTATGLGGAAIGAVVLAPVGLVFSGATLLFLQDHVADRPDGTGRSTDASGST